jgi:hypothetical protein
MLAWGFLNVDTGQIVPARCRRNACGFCVTRNAYTRAKAIAFVRPERAILLTQVGEDFQIVRGRLKRLKYVLQKEIGKEFEWLYHVEPNPAGTGHHGHLWQRGAYIAQRTLSAAAQTVGMGGFARINKIKSVSDASSYGLKGLGYGLKGVHATESRSAYLVANGRRLTHQSRGFFVDSDGERIGVRDAERLATRGGEGAGQWQLIALP